MTALLLVPGLQQYHGSKQQTTVSTCTRRLSLPLTANIIWGMSWAASDDSDIQTEKHIPNDTVTMYRNQFHCLENSSEIRTFRTSEETSPVNENDPDHLSVSSFE